MNYFTIEIDCKNTKNILINKIMVTKFDSFLKDLSSDEKSSVYLYFGLLQKSDAFYNSLHSKLQLIINTILNEQEKEIETYLNNRTNNDPF